MSRSGQYADLPVVEKYVNAREAAEIAGCSRQLLHHHRYDFTTACHISGVLHFERSEIEQWAKDRDAGLVSRPNVPRRPKVVSTTTDAPKRKTPKKGPKVSETTVEPDFVPYPTEERTAS